MVNKHEISKADTGVASIFDPSHLMSVVILYLNEHVVDVATAAPKQSKTIAIVDDYIESKAHSKRV